MLPLLSVLLATCASAAASSSVVSRIFTTADFDALPGSFESWDTFLPCEPSQDSSVDLHLVFSQDVDDYDDVKEVAESVINAFNDSPTSGWHQCFNDVKLLSVGLTMDEDTYNKYQGAVGPNLAFARTFKNYENRIWGDVNSFYLMEIDVQPRKSLWLDVLFEQAQGSTVFGSEYIGRQYAQTWVVDAQDEKHINGNAVYNVRDQTLQALVSEVEAMTLSAVATATQLLPYDLYLSRLAAMIGSKYNSNQNVMANYASTNMVDELFGEEYLQHGARLWNTFKKPVALVISVLDEDDSSLQEILDVLETGVNPFTEAVVFQPRGQDRTVGLTKRDGSKIPVKFQTRNNPFSDLCESIRHVQSGHLHFTNTYHSLKSPIHFFEKKGLPAQWFVDSSHSQCADDEACSYRVRRAEAFTGARVNKHFDDLRTTFDKQAMATFCSQWQEWRDVNPVRGFDPMPGPNADDYMAFLEHNLEVQSPLLNSAKWHDRPTNIRRKVPAADKFTRYFVNDKHYHRKLQENITNTPTSAPTTFPTSSPTRGATIFEFQPNSTTTTITYTGVDTVTTSCITTPAVVSTNVVDGDVVYSWSDETNSVLTKIDATTGNALRPGYEFCLGNVKTGENLGLLTATVTDELSGLTIYAYFNYIVNYDVPSNTNITSIKCKTTPTSPSAIQNTNQTTEYALAIEDAAQQFCILEVEVSQYATATFASLVSLSPGNFEKFVFITVTSAANTQLVYNVTISRALAPRTQFANGCDETRTFAITLGESDKPGKSLTVKQISPPTLILSSNPAKSEVTGPDCWSNGGPCLLNVGSTLYNYSVANSPFNGVNTSDTICQLDIRVTAPTVNKFVKICCYVGNQTDDNQCSDSVGKVVVFEPEAASENITCTGYSKDPNSNDTVANYECFQDGSNTCSRTIVALNNLGKESQSVDIKLQLDVPKDKIPLSDLSINDVDIPLSSNAFAHNYVGTALTAISLKYQTLFNNTITTTTTNTTDNTTTTTYSPSAYTAQVRVGFQRTENFEQGDFLNGIYELLWGVSKISIDSSINDEAFSTTSVGFDLKAPTNIGVTSNTIWLCNAGCVPAEATALCNDIGVWNLNGSVTRFCYQIAETVYAVRGSTTGVADWVADFSATGVYKAYTVPTVTRNGRSASRDSAATTVGRTARRGRRLDALPIVKLSNSEYNITIELTADQTGSVFASNRVPSGVKTLTLDIEKLGDDVLWTSADPLTVIESNVTSGKFTYQFSFQDASDIYTYTAVVLTDPATVSITAQLSCDTSKYIDECPGQGSGGIFFVQTASLTLSLTGTNTDDNGDPIACGVGITSSNDFFLIDESVVFAPSQTSVDLEFTINSTYVGSITDLVGSVIIEPNSTDGQGCQIADGALFLQSDIDIYTKLAPLTATVDQFVTASTDIKAILQVPSRYVEVSGSALLAYPDSLALVNPPLVPFEIASLNTSVEVVFDSFEKLVEPDKYAFSASTQVFKLPIVTNAVASVDTFDVAFAASTATVSLTVPQYQGGSSAEDPIVVNPQAVVEFRATLSKRPFEGIQLVVTTTSPFLTTPDDYSVTLDRIESVRTFIDGFVFILNSVEAGTADQSFTVSVQTSDIVTSANVLYFLIKAPVITISSNDFADRALSEGTPTTPDAFSVNWAVDEFASYELQFALNYENAEGAQYAAITNTVDEPFNSFAPQADTTISYLLSGGNGVVDFGNDVKVTPSTTNVNVQFIPASYNITVTNTETTNVTLVGATADLGRQNDVPIEVSLPIAIEQNFTYVIVQDGATLKSGFVTLPAFATSVPVSFVPQLTGDVSITIAIGTGQLRDLVICEECATTFFVRSVACEAKGGETVFADSTREASSSIAGTTASDGLYESNTGWIGYSNSTYTINLVNQRTLNGIRMRGNGNSSKGAVVEYDMDWSADGVNWNRALTNASGSRADNFDAAAISYMTEPVETAIFVRITPTSFTIQPSLRVEVIGCVNNPCNDSATWRGTYGDCKSYAVDPNTKFCDRDQVDPETGDDSIGPFVESICQVACGKCSVVELPTEAPTGAPTETPPTTSPTSADWPLVCVDDPNFGVYDSSGNTEWAGAYGKCDSYDQSLCTSDDGTPNVFCNFYYCALDGADYYCPKACNTCAYNDPNFKSSFESVTCSYYQDHQFECDMDTNVAPVNFGVSAAKLCSLDCKSYPKKPDDSPLPDCPVTDNSTWLSPSLKNCSVYELEPQYCEFDGAIAIDACPIQCGTCNDCSVLPNTTCTGKCDDQTPIVCPYAHQATCYCDGACGTMDDCCPGRDDVCGSSSSTGRRGGVFRAGRSGDGVPERVGRGTARGARAGKSARRG